jgi:hypothetical protein
LFQNKETKFNGNQGRNNNKSHVNNLEGIIGGIKG